MRSLYVESAVIMPNGCFGIRYALDTFEDWRWMSARDEAEAVRLLARKSGATPEAITEMLDKLRSVGGVS